MHFKVSFKLPNKKSVVQNHVAPNLRELIITLRLSEGVTPENCEWMYIHHHTSNGQVIEVIARENKENSVKCEGDTSNVTNIETAKERRKKKPHIKLSASQVMEKIEWAIKYEGYYKASSGPVWR